MRSAGADTGTLYFDWLVVFQVPSVIATLGE
jgi:hypothetical protein